MKSSRSWISIHAPREGGDVFMAALLTNLGISIHAPREGGDMTLKQSLILIFRFQSTPPARGATLCFCAGVPHLVFQSTPPARGATSGFQKYGQTCCNFNPRPPRGGRRSRLLSENFYDRFQSTPPARGATVYLWPLCLPISVFQSTPPARGATSGYQYEDLRLVVISIHAPREGGDARSQTLHILWDIFQSTPPARGATAKMHSFICESLTNK